MSIELESDLARERLGVWLTERLGAGQVTVGEFTKPKSGFSAETSIVDVTTEAGPRKLVLRREVPDPAVYPQQVPGLDVEIDIQYRTMSALTKVGTVPLAPLVGYEANPEVLGAPFFVMGFIGGDVPTESPPYPELGFFMDASPAQRRNMIDRGLAQLAAIHALDISTVDLDWLRPLDAAPGTAQQVALWRRYAEAELRGREHPLMMGTFDWLQANAPSDDRLGLCWGDPRPGNIIWNDFTPVCLTDFEAVSIGSPMQDLGWWLMFDRTMHPDGSRLEGDPSREQQAAMYEAHSGRPATNLAYHEVFAGVRYSAIVVRVMNRMTDRGHMDPSQTVWLNNPATEALSAILEDHT
jgi:aminoglycoside phosphotransferase (APT) family kinase protein